MADTQSGSKKGWRWLKEPISDAAIFIAIEKILSAIATKGSEEMGKHAAEYVHKNLVDCRGELLADIARMPSADTNNLMTWHKESVAQLNENRFVSLLCKIPVDKDTGRTKILKWLNGLTKEQFDQMLYLLDHDVFLQWLKKGYVTINRIGAADVAWIKARIPQAKKILRQVDHEVAGGINWLANFLEEL